MFRTLIVALFGLCTIPGAAKAQEHPPVSEYFLVCDKETDMFVLMHTWEYYGYETFVDALDYFGSQVADTGRPACFAFAGVVGPEPLKTQVYGETEFLLETDDGLSVWVPLYLWSGETENDSFSVLSTTLP
jgi:hypothetical protein